MNISSIEFLTAYWEQSINEKTMYYDYVFPYDEVMGYVSAVNDISLYDLVDVIKKADTKVITAKEVFQFSNFDDCTERICKVLKEVNNPGLTFLEAGKLLLDDGKARTDTAYTKYGENHLKTGELLGLIFSLSNTYFLSAIGTVYCDLSEDNKARLLTRLVLRSRLVSRLLSASEKGTVDMRQFLYMLSDSTYVRRRSNIKRVLNVLKLSDEYDFSNFINQILFSDPAQKEKYNNDSIGGLKAAETEKGYEE